MLYYLEDKDISPTGEFMSSNDTKATILMLKASWCGHCKNATPAFENFANKFGGEYLVIVGLADGKDKVSDETIKNAGGKGFRGYPHYVSFASNGKMVSNNIGGRDEKSLLEFAKKAASA